MKDDVEDGAEEENQGGNTDLTPHENEKIIKEALIPGAPKTGIDSYFDQTKPHIRILIKNQLNEKRVYKDIHDPMGRVEEVYRATY